MHHRNQKKSVSKRKRTQRDVDDAIAAIIASTKRKKRKLDPLQVSEKLLIAREALGGMRELSETVGLSPEMIRQILSVRKCAPAVKQLVHQGRLTSFDILHRLSKLSHSDQNVVAKAVVKGYFNSNDVRVLVGLRRSSPDARIGDLVERVQRSRNIKHYVAYFAVPKAQDIVRKLRERLSGLLGEDNLISITINDQLAELVMNRKGKDRLQKHAKGAKKTKRCYLEGLARKG